MTSLGAADATAATARAADVVAAARIALFRVPLMGIASASGPTHVTGADRRGRMGGGLDSDADENATPRPTLETSRP